MFILDTNIVSEVMRNIPSTEVMAWLDEFTAEFEARNCIGR